MHTPLYNEVREHFSDPQAADSPRADDLILTF